MGLEKRMPLVCQAGPAAEASVGSLPSVENNITVNNSHRGVNSTDAGPAAKDSSLVRFVSHGSKEAANR